MVILGGIGNKQGSDIGTQLVSCSCLGVNTIVRTDYPQPHFRCDLAHGEETDPYTGLDQFGRVVDLRWWSPEEDRDIERIRHGYDRAGNRLWRECPVATAAGKAFDELYSYDRLNQLQTFARGRLNGDRTGLVARNFAQAWDLDATGNWSGFAEDREGDGIWDQTQTRHHNAANEITDIHAGRQFRAVPGTAYIIIDRTE